MNLKQFAYINEAQPYPTSLLSKLSFLGENNWSIRSLQMHQNMFPNI